MEHPGELFLRGKNRTAPGHDARGHAGGWFFRTGRCSCGRLLRERTGDDGACAYTTLQVAFGQKLGIGIEYGKAGHADFRGEESSGRNPLARTEAAVHDGGAECGIDLPVKRSREFSVDRNHRKETGSNAFHFRRIIVVMQKGRQVGIVSDHFGWEACSNDLADPPKESLCRVSDIALPVQGALPDT